MRKYTVSAEVTISIWTIVEAASPEEAKEMAAERSMPSLCHQCAGSEGADEEWRTSGDLDGEATNLRIDDGEDRGEE